LALVALDGVTEAPDTWSLQTWTHEAGTVELLTVVASGALLLRRGTYEAFEAGWPSLTDEKKFADGKNGRPKFVATTSRTELAGTALRLDGDIAAAAVVMNEQPDQDLSVLGSVDLSHTLRQRPD